MIVIEHLVISLWWTSGLRQAVIGNSCVLLCKDIIYEFL